MGIEQKINNSLRKFPVIKKTVKRCYQLANVAISRPKKSEGMIEQVTPDDGCEYFFGYYDKSPWNATDRYMLCLRAKDTTKSVAPKDPADIILIDTKEKNSITRLATTHSWNVQQGCMAGWLGPEYKDKIFYNDFRNGKHCGVILDIKTNSENVFDTPFYTVSNDGKTALTLDFTRLHRLRPGYGYSNLEDKTKGEKVPDGPCVWRIDLETKKIVPILTYHELYNFQHRPEMDDANHKVNHLMLSPNGKRFMVIHRWLKGGKKYSRLLTCGIDGKDLYNLSDDDMVSHCYWKNNKEILAFCRKNKTDGYYLMEDKTKEYERKWDFLTSDGHPSYSPEGGHVVTDTYPNRSRISTIRILDDNSCEEIAKVYSPFKYDNDTRCDLHPRWSRDGKYICFDGCFDKKRELFIVRADANTERHSVLSDIDEESKTETKGMVSCIIPTYKRSDTLSRAIDSILSQTYGNIEVLIVDDNVPGDKYSKEAKKKVDVYKNDKRVRLITQEKHINGAVARNVGIKNARGEFLAFLDDDDEWEPDKLEKQIAAFDKETGIVTTLWAAYKNEKMIRKCPIYSTDDIQFKIFNRDVSIYTSTVVMKKSVALAFKGFDETLKRHQDLQFLIDATELTKMKLVQEYLVKLHIDSEINKPDTEKMIEIKKAFFESERDKLGKYSKKSINRIRSAHNFEIVFSALKEKKMSMAIKYALKTGFRPSAIADVYKRLRARR